MSDPVAGAGDAATQGSVPARAAAVSNVVWSWADALRGSAYALPAALVAPADPERGVALALGVLPACLVPLPAARRSRAVVALLGGLCGMAMLLGAGIAQLPSVVGALALLGVVLTAALAASVWPAGRVLLVLGAPLTAIGLSFSDWRSAGVGALLMAGGSLYAWAVSLLWPAGDGRARAPMALPSRAEMRRYGLLLGTCAGVAWIITAWLGVDHPGWAPAACLLVARPDVTLLRLRAVGRVIAVTAGAVGGVAAVAAELSGPVIALLTVATVGGAAATRGSRWYVTSGFTTFLVVLMLLLQHPEQSGQKLGERILETLLGVGLALVAGLLGSVVSAGEPERPVS